MSVAVHLNRPPFSARLVAWGRADDGWWGCILFAQRVRGAEAVDELPVAVWVPAGALNQPGWAAPQPIPRTVLPPDRRAWPPPPGWPNWYAGVWADGALTLPAGVEAVTGPAWRERRRR